MPNRTKYILFVSLMILAQRVCLTLQFGTMQCNELVRHAIARLTVNDLQLSILVPSVLQGRTANSHQILLV
jgi:hypothetical protein